jgi:preprotein translocase subunit SecA
MVEESCPPGKQAEDWDWKSIHQGFREHFRVDPPKSIDEIGDSEHLVRELYKFAEAAYLEKEKELGSDILLRAFRHIYVEGIDEAWVDHLSNMEHLRDGIGLRGYGQRDPKNEYKKEGYNLFLNMMAKISSTVLVKLFEVQAHRQEELAALEAQAEAKHRAELEAAIARHPGEADPTPEAAPLPTQARRSAPPAPKIGRNDLCPCGSGKKFKRCHGAILEEEGVADDDDETEDAAASA